jgi:hypothetical protein
MTLACLVTTKKFVMNFKQQKTNLNAERKRLHFWNNASRRWKQHWLLVLSLYFRLSAFFFQALARPSAWLLLPLPRMHTLLLTLIHGRTHPPPLEQTLLPMQAATPRMRWVGGIKCPLAAPLLQVGSGGVGRRQLWRNIGQQNMVIKIVMVGPHVWQQI